MENNDTSNSEEDKSPEDSLEHVEGLINQGMAYDEIISMIANFTSYGTRERLIHSLRNREKNTGITKEAIRADIQRHRWDEPIENDRKENNIIKLTDEEKREALDLLKDSKILSHFLDITELLGSVGETENKVALYLAMTSRKQDNPINATVKGESSAGKTFLVNSVLPFFPDGDVLEFTYLSPKALFHRKDSLKHKILIVHERPGAEAADYSIRVLQSEKKLKFSMPVKNSDTGEFETKDYEVEGPIAYIETTTNTHLHAENETRCFDLYIDESEEQTKKIHNAMNRKHEIDALNREEILRPFKNAQRLLEPYPVFIPYIEHIKFPTKPVRVRRDKLRFITLIEASAFLRQHIREKRIINDKEFVVASIDDYRVAHRLITKILESVLRGLSPKVKELLEAVKGLGGVDFTKKGVSVVIDWNEKTVDKYLCEAIEWGYIKITKQGSKGVEYHYKLGKSDLRLVDLLTPDELEKEIQNNKTTIPSKSP